MDEFKLGDRVVRDWSDQDRELWVVMDIGPDAVDDLLTQAGTIDYIDDRVDDQYRITWDGGGVTYQRSWELAPADE